MLACAIAVHAYAHAFLLHVLLVMPSSWVCDMSPVYIPSLISHSNAETHTHTHTHNTHTHTFTTNSLTYTHTHTHTHTHAHTHTPHTRAFVVTIHCACCLFRWGRAVHSVTQASSYEVGTATTMYTFATAHPTLQEWPTWRVSEKLLISFFVY